MFGFGGTELVGKATGVVGNSIDANAVDRRVVIWRLIPEVHPSRPAQENKVNLEGNVGVLAYKLLQLGLGLGVGHLWQAQQQSQIARVGIFAGQMRQVFFPQLETSLSPIDVNAVIIETPAIKNQPGP